MQPFIFTDSTADIPSIRKYEDFDVLQLSYSLDDDQYDNITKSITPKEFYDRMRQGAKSATSMVNQVYAMEKIEEVLKQGRDVIYLAFSSALSGTYNVGCQVVKELQAKYPDRKIILAGGQGDNETIPESEGMKNYLIQNGISKDRIIEENTSRNTIQNFENSKKISVKPIKIIIKKTNKTKADILDIKSRKVP